MWKTDNIIKKLKFDKTCLYLPKFILRTATKAPNLHFKNARTALIAPTNTSSSQAISKDLQKLSISSFFTKLGFK